MHKSIRIKKSFLLISITPLSAPTNLLGGSIQSTGYSVNKVYHRLYVKASVFNIFFNLFQNNLGMITKQLNLQNN